MLLQRLTISETKSKTCWIASDPKNSYRSHRRIGTSPLNKEPGLLAPRIQPLRVRLWPRPKPVNAAPKGAANIIPSAIIPTLVAQLSCEATKNPTPAPSTTVKKKKNFRILATS